MKEPAAVQVQQNAPSTRSGAVLQRACACGQHVSGTDGECENCKRNRRILQRSAIRQNAPVAAPPTVRDVLRSPGRSLDPTVRTFFEAQFEHDFSNVRLHMDAKAAASAQAVNARAYTVGRNVVFGAGYHQTGASRDQQLLAHELTHVVQQSHSSGSLSDLEIAPADTRQEREAASISTHFGRIAEAALTPASYGIQRQPSQPSLRDQICYQQGQVPQRQPGDCDTREPENCPTYEQWINSFRRLTTFSARDTAPGGTETTGFTVFGQQATRPVDNPTPPAVEQPTPEVNPKVADRFIDHPTDQWVRTCLPDNLRETAYRLPSDCADIAVILRHVWLSAHHRTEVYGRWTVGDRAGRARRADIGRIIRQVYSGNVASTLNPYSDSNGRPLKRFAELRDLLHPGDVLVWEHHSGGLGTRRTGGDTETIMRVIRTGNQISRIEVIQGNQPIFQEQAQEIRAAIGRGAPSESVLRDAPGRRIELHELSGSDLRDLQLPPRQGQASSTQPQSLWTLADGHTTLVAAGPPRSVRRPPTRRLQGQRIRRISDWFAPLRGASLKSMPGILEAALLELRSLIERGQAGLDTEATRLGQTAGERLWNLAHRAPGLGDESHFRPLQRLRGMIQALGNPAGQRGLSSSATPQAANVRRIFELVDDAFHLAARGASTISFNRRGHRGARIVRVLVTGFDPFVGTGAVPAGVVNPSGAAALALDNTTVSAGRGAIAAVEGIVLPVNFEDFRQGMVENIVRPLVQNRGVDAVLTVSLDESIAPSDPVRLERFVVGVHQDGQLGPVPAAPPSGIGPAIIETQAPLEAIAQETALSARQGRAGIPQPKIGTDVTLRFPTTTIADQALTALGLPQSGNRDAIIADVSALRQIIATMQRASNGIDISFQAGGQNFQAAVVSGPGGNFLSNEVSFRMLRLLGEQKRLDITSFHVHVPRALPKVGGRIPQDTSTRTARSARRRFIRFATRTRDRIIVTLRRMIQAVARRIAARPNP